MSQRIRAYGDRHGDGMVQMSFTLAVSPSPKAREAAKQYAEKHGLKEPIVATMEECAKGFCFFVVYGNSQAEIDFDTIDVPVVESPTLSREEIDSRLKAFGRKVVVVGACTGSDAHTVGIDAILNYKGFAGDKGLESYKGFESFNLGAQVENDQLIERALATSADVLLVSQVITQRNCHKENGAALVEMLRARSLRERFVLLFGGPRVDHKLALELGFDAGFGPGTKPSDVASFIIEAMSRRAKP